MENNTNLTNKIQKPLTLATEETKTNLVNVVNEALSQMHPTLVSMIIREVLVEVQAYERTMFERENAEYQRAIAEAKESEEVESDTISDDANNA